MPATGCGRAQIASLVGRSSVCRCLRRPRCRGHVARQQNGPYRPPAETAHEAGPDAVTARGLPWPCGRIRSGQHEHGRGPRALVGRRRHAAGQRREVLPGGARLVPRRTRCLRDRVRGAARPAHRPPRPRPPEHTWGLGRDHARDGRRGRAQGRKARRAGRRLRHRAGGHGGHLVDAGQAATAGGSSEAAGRCAAVPALRHAARCA